MNSVRCFFKVAPFVLSLCLGGCAASSADSSAEADQAVSARSDLTRDLAKPGGALGTPFKAHDVRPLPPAVFAGLKALSERCLQTHETVHWNGTRAIPGDQSICPNEIGKPVHDEAKWTDRVDFQLASDRFTAVIWDGEDSDGGDQVDIAFYDAKGSRIGVYKGLYTDDSVLDNLGYVTEAKVATVVDPYQPDDVIGRDVMFAGASPFTAADAKPLDDAHLTAFKSVLESCLTKVDGALKEHCAQVFVSTTTQPGVTYATVALPNGGPHQTDFFSVIRRPNGDVAFYPPGDSRLAVYLGRSEGDLLSALVAITGAAIH